VKIEEINKKLISMNDMKAIQSKAKKLLQQV